ncbi:hypothetical protein TSAR_011861 [Trichomalopsis sarcophagae]|uniref:Uncharacterized protein n=1 Tax=Trichomalopsis sarcophagae TaxID=543379 RepID=A0A232EYI6_9HYME|nr:hypothetical protein TSAR_011861 [Trichomalopsis sarcophagae]
MEPPLESRTQQHYRRELAAIAGSASTAVRDSAGCCIREHKLRGKVVFSEGSSVSSVARILRLGFPDFGHRSRDTHSMRVVSGRPSANDVVNKPLFFYYLLSCWSLRHLWVFVTSTSTCVIERQLRSTRYCPAVDMVIKDFRRNNVLAELEAISLQNSVARYTAQVQAMQARIDVIASHFTVHDPCEIRISGLPDSSDLSIRDMAERVFAAIGCPDFGKHVLEVREWLHRPANDTAGQSEQGNGRRKRCIVVQFISNVVRDMVLRSVKKLDKQISQSLFGTGDKGKIYVNIVYPRSVYQLRKKAISVAKSHNYAKPVVKNLVVCMRERHDSPLIPVYSEEDLAMLPRRIRCPCDNCRRRLVNP